MHYQDKVTIITGGTKGIGEGVRGVFVDAGAKVVFCARKQEEGGALAAELDAKLLLLCLSLKAKSASS